mgnify:FL=1
MNITEKNREQYDLRQEMYKAQQKVEFCKQRIAQLQKEYEAQFETPLFEEMFGG